MPRVGQPSAFSALASHEPAAPPSASPLHGHQRATGTPAHASEDTQPLRPLTFADLLAMQYRGDGTMALIHGRRHQVLITVFTRLHQPAVRVVVADAATQAIRARRHFYSLSEAVSFTNEALFR